MDHLVTRAPTRIDFGGGWTDVPPYSDERGGVVCSAAIELHARATIRRAPEKGVSAAGPDDALARAAVRRSGIEGIDLSISVDYPVGAGLGGSSAAGVAALGALAHWRGEAVEPRQLAEESRLLEVDDLGIAGGRQDHYAAAFGGVLGLWFGGTTRLRQFDSAELADRLGAQCVVAYTGQSRISGDTIIAVLNAYRARDRRVIGTLDRMRDLAREMIAALDGGDVRALGALVGEHWVHQRALHPAIPTPLIDHLLDVAGRAGALGGKALGASGGGCILAIAPEDRVAEVRAALEPLARLLPVRIARRGFEVLEPASTRSTAAVPASA
jgi:D-glycero-alpha-D-manno-heptose-7-phosphate kinase